MEWEKVSIDKMDIKDLDEVVSMEDSSSLTFWSKNMFIEEMSNPNAHCFVIKCNGDPENHHNIGFICFRNIGDESELLNICVHPEYRHLGIGKRLIQFYIGFCSKMGIKTFYLEVNSSNLSAIHLYQLFSFEPLGTRKKFYQGRFDALLMVKKA